MVVASMSLGACCRGNTSAFQQRHISCNHLDQTFFHPSITQRLPLSNNDDDFNLHVPLVLVSDTVL